MRIASSTIKGSTYSCVKRGWCDYFLKHLLAVQALVLPLSMCWSVYILYDRIDSTLYYTIHLFLAMVMSKEPDPERLAVMEARNLISRG